jgi:carbonic anhydrase
VAEVSNQMNSSGVSADEALQRLTSGNERFVRGEVTFTGLRREALLELTAGQRPFATILGCSDSRVPPELIFDARLSELFVVRVAGNVFSPEIAATLQYAGVHLDTPLFVVLGHEGCGAVSAALKTRDEDELHRSRIQLLVERILPGLPAFDPSLSTEEKLAKAVESNVRWTVRQILDTPEGRLRQKEGRMKIIGAIYEISSGRVRFLEMPQYANQHG